MNEAQTKAWECLREEEQQSLFLQLSSGKSTWESGTILKKSHYKYIEIRDRSQKFFKMFTEFFDKHPSIFRPDAPYNPRFRDYIEGCIEKRLTRKEAAVFTGDSTQVFSSVRVPMLENNLSRLRESEDEWDKDTFSLIIEFDRWNNFRVLPRLYQAPSAYKRRCQSKYKIYINYLLNKLPLWIHDRIIERYRYRLSPKNSKPRYWIALISRDKYEDGYYVFPVKVFDEVVNEMSRLFIYVFTTKDDADTFGFMVDKFTEKTNSKKSGMNFWREFQEVLETAVNFKQVNYIDFNMNTLDMAYNVHRPKKKPKKDKALKGNKRAKEDLFYT